MTGFRGQKFDFVGRDGAWYAVVSNLPHIHLNMRVTSPVPSVPGMIYITGVSIVTTDGKGLGHTIGITVIDPHSLQTSCRVGVPSCLAEGSLHVVMGEVEAMTAPGQVNVAGNIAICAVNFPGACRSFGFQKYWERKELDVFYPSDRKLSLINSMQNISD